MNSNEIKELRKKYFSNQQSFADICGFERASVQRWEAGKKQPLKSHLILMELYRDIPAVREYLTREEE
jgi:DNA-binding transcriptional regulator YiaG